MFMRRRKSAPSIAVETTEMLGRKVTLKRSNRRTLAVYIVKGAVEVRAPHGTNTNKIERFLDEKSDWIDKKLASWAARPKAPKRNYVLGETLPVWGDDMAIVPVPGHTRVRQEGSRLLVPEDPERAARMVEVWLRRRADETLTAMTHDVADRLGRSVHAVRMWDFKRTWGNCAPDGTIKYNFRILLAPPNVIEYLVVHEVSHLKHPNHSSAFWKTVEGLMPNYKSARKWLKEHGHLLVL